MKAKLLISINGESFEDFEMELLEDVSATGHSPSLIAYRLEARCSANEKKVRQAIARSINTSPLRYGTAHCWEAVLICESGVNKMI